MTVHSISYGDSAYPQRLSANQINKSDAATTSKTALFSDKLNQAVSSSKVDTIELSKRKVKPTLSQIRDDIVSDIRKDKDAGTIEKLRTQIESGTYQMDSKEIARRMLSADGK